MGTSLTQGTVSPLDQHITTGSCHLPSSLRMGLLVPNCSAQQHLAGLSPRARDSTAAEF